VNGLGSQCKKCLSETAAEWNKKFAVRVRAKGLKTRYGITSDDYDRMFRDQNGVCKICGTVLEGNLQVDHCHTTKVVRGLLCGNCNLLLGYAKDNPEILQSAITYLNASHSNTSLSED
jgi:hypothetical protein